MTDIKLLELPDWTKRDDATQNMVPSELRSAMAGYARANVKHCTEKLRADVERWERAFKDNYLAEKARAERLEESLRSVERYGADTLSGPTTDTDDRSWYRAGVVAMVRRAQAALRDGESQFPQNSKEKEK